MLQRWGNHFEGILSLQPMFLPKRFDIPPPLIVIGWMPRRFFRCIIQIFFKLWLNEKITAQDATNSSLGICFNGAMIP